MYSRFFVTQLGSNSVKKFFKIYLSAEAFQISNHVENGWVFALKSKALHS
jgi:hypothetical protein